ncbi:MAG: B12-binding domain-containing radical SAM protein [Bacteroidetes bacterium]|nr:B12-binding domain-containing radical SAM protein [Bacteroidota bacterium]MCK5765121.1 B12-binding domain-containing radical SAM protein [Bacteroidales bacterium]
MYNKKLILINPFNQHTRKDVYDVRTISPPLSLGIIAGLTPDDWDIEIIDENFDDFTFKEADLVGITALTSSINRAYEISAIYRERGIPTVIGGIHASMVTEEAEKYADVVVTGEAESVWHKVIEDFKQGTLKKRYTGELLPMKNNPMPRRDLFHPSYSYANIQTSRGCPMNCDFCSVHNFNGHQYRQRSVEDVLDELETIPQEQVYFVDDNIIGYSKQSAERAIRLFKGIVDRGIKIDWYCQASLNVADNEDVLKWAAKSGCRMILIGIESEKEEQLQEANKSLNLKMGIKKYEEVFDRIHKYGISVLGTLIFGLDSDSKSDLYDRTQFAIESGMDGMQATIITPLPGTGLYKRMEKDKRLLKTNYPEDWKYYHFLDIVYQPAKMSPDELYDEMLKNWGIMYDGKLLQKKMLRTLKATQNPKAAVWSYLSNVERHNICFGNRKAPLDPNILLKSLQNVG